MYFCNCILTLCNVFEGYLISSLALASNMINKASFLLISALLTCCGAEDTGMLPNQLQMNTEHTNIRHSIVFFKCTSNIWFGRYKSKLFSKYFFFGATNCLKYVFYCIFFWWYFHVILQQWVMFSEEIKN